MKRHKKNPTFQWSLKTFMLKFMWPTTEVVKVENDGLAVAPPTAYLRLKSCKRRKYIFLKLILYI